MSFLSVLSKVKQGVQIGAAVVPAVVGGPVIASVFGTLLTAVTLVEQLVPDGQGAAKHQIVSQIVKSAHPDEVRDVDVSKAIDQLVAALNTLAAVK